MPSTVGKDEFAHYKTVSTLTFRLSTNTGNTLGVLQLISPTDDSGKTGGFDDVRAEIKNPQERNSILGSLKSILRSYPGSNIWASDIPSGAKSQGIYR